MASYILYILGIFFLVHNGSGEVETKITPKGVSEKESIRFALLPPCGACRVLTDSFKKVSYRG